GVGEFRKIVHGSNNRKTGATLSKEIVQKIKKIDYLNTYFDVFMSTSVASDQGIVFEMQLNQEKFKSINWETSKRLIFGSLVCFSSDHFLNECLIGVISERDDKNFKRHGRFNVKFDYDSINLDINCIPELNRPYVMLETSAFFESYKHVLKALQSFQREGEENFPFKENLVYCQNREIPMPNYLKNACIDFRPLVDAKKKFVTNKQTKLNDYEFSQSCLYAEKCFLSNSASWPTAEQMRLDESQYEAVKLALTNKLALIQGPPGTGKTFLGVKIIQLLLHNKHSWWNRGREKHKPILMICYTNHALDQFLEYCIHECNLTQGIVRVGGRSKSEDLEPFLLKNIKADLRKKRKIQGNIHHRLTDQIIKVRDIKFEINALSTKLSSIFFGESLLSFNEISNYIRDDHLDQLITFGYELFKQKKFDENYFLLDWLGIFDMIDKNDDIVEQFENLNISNEPTGEIITGNFEDLDQDDIGTQSNKVENSQIKKEEEKFDFNDDDSVNEQRMLEEDFINFQDLKLEEFNFNFTGILNIPEIYEMIKAYKKLHGINESGWKIKKNKKSEDPDLVYLEENLKNIFSHLTNRFDQDDLDLIENTSNIWRLTYPERYLLYLKWLNRYKADKQMQIQNLSNQYNQETNILLELRLQEDRSIMEDAFI
ncbi:unnamed protein product, partial [Brachionus calyciflorus]